jgi:hypothetical protein
MEPKDWVGVATGTIGCVAGLYSLYRSIRIQNTIYGERYFKPKWLIISPPLDTYAVSCENYLRQLSSTLDEDLPERLPDIEVDNFRVPTSMNWRHDKDLKSLIDKIGADVITINENISYYNRLSFVGSDFFTTYLFTTTFPEADDQEQEEMIARRNQRLSEFEALTKKYLGRDNVTYVSELAQAPGYINERKSKAHLVRQQCEQLTELIKKLKDKVEEYDTIFE